MEVRAGVILKPRAFKRPKAPSNRWVRFVDICDKLPPFERFFDSERYSTGVFARSSTKVDSGGLVKVGLLILLCLPALGSTLSDRRVCQKVNETNAQRPAVIHAKAVPLRQISDPFVPGLLPTLSKIIAQENGYGHARPAFSESKIATEAAQLASKRFGPGVYSVNPKESYQVRYDEATKHFAIIAKEGRLAGQVVFFYPLGEVPIPGFSDHLSFLNAATDGRSFGPALGVSPLQIARLIPESLRVHYDKHGLENAAKWTSAEKYEEDAIAFAGSDNPRLLLIQKHERTGDVLIKYDPVENVMLVLTRQYRLEDDKIPQWRITTYFRPSVAKHKMGTNLRYFLSHLAPSERD